MKNKKENFKDMKDTDLAKKLAGFREDARVITFKAEGSRSKNVKELASIKKNIARVMTAMNAPKLKS